MGGAFAASIIEPSTTNILVWLILLAVLGGDTFFTSTENPWGRWIAQGLVVLVAPFRMVSLGFTIIRSIESGSAGILGRTLLGFVLALPTLGLLVIFSWLLSSGNAIFNLWTSGFFQSLWTALEGLLDPLRIFLWALIGTLILPFIWPGELSDRWWKWMTQLPRCKNITNPRHLIFSSGLILLAMNLLFGVANIADAVFLWSGAALPAGVTYSQFVHSGVTALIGTVVLSGIVLTAVFQQSIEVVRNHGLRAMAVVWISQNIFLILSVFLRLKRYIEAYDMTVSRLGVIIFLILVALGYGLLVMKIVQDRSLSWFLGGLILVSVTVLYVTQFLDLAGWSADYNVARWQQDQQRTLDVTYLEQLGAAAWPALRAAHMTDPARLDLQGAVLAQQSWINDLGNDWREWTLRRWLNERILFEK